MNTIKRDVYVLRDTIKIPIEVTKGTDMVGFEFAVRDYSIPGTVAAVAYVYHKSMEKPKGILCDINDSTISFTPDNNFFAVGMNELQIRVINNGKSLISFKEKIKCSDAMGFPDDEEESQQTLVEQLLTKVGKEEGDRKTADETEREERIAADAEEKKARAEADETIRANRIVALDEIDLVTEEGFFVDALAVKELNSNLVNAKNKLTALSDSINNLGSTKTVKLANKSSSNGVATYTDYVTLPSAGSYVIYCNATMSGTPTSGVSNLGIQVNSVDGTGGFHSVGSCSHNGFAIDLNGFYVLTTKVSNEKIRLRLYQNGGYAETWKNISVYYKKIL